MARGRGVLSDGRSKKARFLRLPHGIYDHDNFRALNPPARVVLLELIRRFNGVNNGKIGFPIRAGRELGLGQMTTVRALRRLIAAGFVHRQRKGAFTTKTRLAAEYRLTWLPANGQAPTLEYRSVTPSDEKDGTISEADSNTSEAEEGREAA